LDTALTLAARALAGDPATLAELSASLLVPERNNFVERPWGGTLIREFKHQHPLPDQQLITGFGLGEAFEIAAFDDDDEAARYPSRIRCDDGSLLSLPSLLAAHGAVLLGEHFVGRHGACLPLLPKTLDVKELLSVQGHPAGNTEVYIILDAEPGATLRLGFKNDQDPDSLVEVLLAGLARQRKLVSLLGPGADLVAVQRAVQPWFADPGGGVPVSELVAELRPPHVESSEAVGKLLVALKRDYRDVLDRLNEIELKPGLVIHNATPSRLLAPGQQPSAEVHALGNPEGREMLALEIRRPGPTFRAWDNVRFPPRAVDVRAAIDALNLRATAVDEFIREPRPEPGRPGVSCAVDSEAFRIERLRPTESAPIELPAAGPYCLHVTDGQVQVEATAAGTVRELSRGESALVPIGCGACRIASRSAAEVISVRID
jgi:mannose-6-phosphate isomerase class I